MSNSNEITTYLSEFLTGIADAIRSKKGTTELINPQDFATAIMNLKSGDTGGDAALSCLTFSSPNTFTLNTGGNNKYWDGTLEYSIDANNWIKWDGTSISSSTDGKLYMRGTGNTYITNSTASNKANVRWVLTGSDISCSGNIENLLDYQTVANGEHPIMANRCYNYMFRNCSSLTTAPELPATTLTEECYSHMFYGCSSLMIAPELPATTLRTECYVSMFNTCTSLTTAPELPATTLAQSCYSNMFADCTSLTTAPELPATTLAQKCYLRMFDGCIVLMTLPNLPATTLVASCYNYMFSECKNIKLSTTQTEDYQTAYRIPTSGSGTFESGADSSALVGMFSITGGTFKDEPSINKTYYTSNTVI